MSFCLTELHLWSLKNTLHIGDRDIGTYQYYDKKEPSATDHGNLEEKQRLAESRDFPWTLKNRRPEKLRDSLKELEELMQNSQCVLSKWKNKYVCQLLFGSGELVSLSLSGPQLEKVLIDRSLVGKLISDTISDALLTDGFIILSFLAQNKLCFIQFAKKMSSPDTNRRLEKLSALDYKISHYEIPGPVNRTIQRRLAINCVQDTIVCWWPLVSDDAWPWTPISSEKDGANLLLLSYAQGRLEVLSSVRTEWDPLDVRFDTRHPNQMLTVECSISVDREPAADSCVYECVRNKIQCVSVTRIPLKSKAISCCRNATDDKLILGCEDSSVILYETHRRVTLLAQAELLPSLISCHPSGAILLVGSNQGELQIFDMALSPINIQLLAEDNSPRETLQFKKFFDVSSSLVQMQWIAPQVVSKKPESGDIYNLLFLRFDRGPLGVLLFKLGIFTQGHLGLVDIIFQYVHCDEIYEAINILSSMNWDTLGYECFISMCAIVNHLLRQKLTPEREAQLEASLGTFYAPTRPLLDTTVLEYRDQISKYARRFFHHLLRYQRFEKAFLLAVDIGARDLFMEVCNTAWYYLQVKTMLVLTEKLYHNDIHYLALDKGELALAEVARRRASDIDAESITSGVGYNPRSCYTPPLQHISHWRNPGHKATPNCKKIWKLC
nr:WD repeat-containing and planar cell polarity effector protein fritz homolog isoform X2 [Odocoileus virginianus texanus]XP_020728656.1 WD repeat-containing and planar cell polarity effector protein fritz homolog isoform X2 [Odocoileus virginianus texanus]XP_020728657.1 WD repeat-containing and planar cell polarity effector protein fritz homolog isoform X2 [Odocoileus virginianus texanus]XP_020728658.1 WD repeat-containing and planar cell polarity effector protein fritz homolog isoform X2 [Odo